MLINKSDSCLLIIDVQERLAPAINEPRKVIDGCSRLLRGAAIMKIPVLITEQYPKGLGPTLFDVREAAPKDVYFEKTNLSAASEPGFIDRLSADGKNQIVIAGVEMHICVLQTAIELKEKGYEVFIVTDACGSRLQESEAAAMRRFMQEGIAMVTIEMVLFEWLRESGTSEFKEIQTHLIR